MSVTGTGRNTAQQEAGPKDPAHQSGLETDLEKGHEGLAPGRKRGVGQEREIGGTKRKVLRQGKEGKHRYLE